MGRSGKAAADPAAFAVGQDGDDPELAVGAVTHAEADDLAVLLADPSLVGGGQAIYDRRFRDTGTLEGLEREAVLLSLGTDPDAASHVAWFHFADDGGEI